MMRAACTVDTVAVWLLIGPQLDRGEVMVSKPDVLSQDDDIFNLLYWPSDGGAIFETTSGKFGYQYLPGHGALSSAWHHIAATFYDRALDDDEITTLATPPSTFNP
jgi:hypothetical protein